jgi:hypothetical protein
MADIDGELEPNELEDGLFCSFTGMAAGRVSLG